MMPKNSEFTEFNIPERDTKHNRTTMQVGGMPFGRFGQNKQVHNNVFGGINSDLIGRVVRDERKDDNNKEKNNDNEEKSVDTSTTDNSTNNSTINQPNVLNKSNKNEEEALLKDIIELEKLRLLKEMNKEKKQEKNIDTDSSGFDNDYPYIVNNKGNRLFDTIGNQWFINNTADKERKHVEQFIKQLFVPNEDYIHKYRKYEKELKKNYDDEYAEKRKDFDKQGKDLKFGINVANFNLKDDLQELLNDIMNRTWYGKIDGKYQLTLTKENLYAIATHIATLDEKLTTEIKERKSNGIILDQSAINARKEIKNAISPLLWRKSDLLDINNVKSAIEEDCEKMSQIYNSLNIFQRFWYALLDLIFGTNYNQEYQDIVAIQRLMIKELDLSNDELDPVKHYKHILSFCDLANKLDNVRENMASYLLYPEQHIVDDIKKFKKDAFQTSRSADQLFVSLFKICGGSMLAPYISEADKSTEPEKKHMIDKLVEQVEIKGVHPTNSQKREIFRLALLGKSGKEINDELGLINDDTEDKDGKISALDRSVSSGLFAKMQDKYIDKGINEKSNIWKAKSFGYLYLIKQQYAINKINHYDELLDKTTSFLRQAINNSTEILAQKLSFENMSGLSSGSSQVSKILERAIIGNIETAYGQLMKIADDKFKENEGPDEEYEKVKKHITGEMEKISTDKLSEEDKKNGKKPDTRLAKLKEDKFEEMNMLSELLDNMKSVKQINKEYHEKIKAKLKEDCEKAIACVKETASLVIQNKNLMNALQAHSKHDERHLNVFRDVENTRSKHDGRHYRDMVKVLTSRGGKGGPGMMNGYF